MSRVSRLFGKVGGYPLDRPPPRPSSSTPLRPTRVLRALPVKVQVYLISHSIAVTEKAGRVIWPVESAMGMILIRSGLVH